MSRLTVVAGEVVKKTVTKSKFSQINDKRFYFPDGVVPLPFGHPLLKEMDEFKQEKGQKIEKYKFWEEKKNLLNLENKALKEHPRLYLYRQILRSATKNFNISQKIISPDRKTLLKRDAEDIVLRRMDHEVNYTYDAKFEGKILVVGRTGCGKTSYVQNLRKNEMFGDIKEVLWISKIALSSDKEYNTRDCFTEQKVHFRYPNDIEDFNDLLEFCQRKKIKL